MSDSKTDDILYQLIFEGPEKEDPTSLRKLRTTLVSDLELNVERAKFVIDMAPAVVQESTNEQDLIPVMKSLNNSGGKALIVRHAKVQQIRKEKRQALSKSYLSDTEAELKIEGEEPVSSTDEAERDPWGAVPLRTVIGESKKEEEEIPAPVVPDPIRKELRRRRLKRSTRMLETYRDWIDAADVIFRRYINKEIAATVITMSVISIFTCSILIPLELYARSAREEHYLRVNKMFDAYVDVAVYGDSIEHPELVALE